MSRLPRFALGTVQPEVDSHPVSWALLEALTRNGCQTQHFFSRACHSPCTGAATATGLTSRHLDSWLMSRAMCRATFARGISSSELAVVEGRFDAARAERRGPNSGSSLDTLCDWLGLPRIVVVDVSRLQSCRLGERLQADAVLLDRVQDSTDFCRWKTTLEALWGVPVLGALETLPLLRAALAAVPVGSPLPRDICEQLGTEFSRYARLDDLHRLAARRDFSAGEAETAAAAPGDTLSTPMKIAVAFDQAFHCYFADTLDALESLGATVVDFSPLHEESLPADTDIVYIGCGHPELHAAALAENHCMLSALRTHLCSGRRIFADGGGLAYLCQHMETSDGKWAAMVGALPAIARRNPHPTPPQPVELTLSQTTWLGPAGQPVRGYLGSGWLIEPNGHLTNCIAESGHEHDLIGLYNALGSRVQMHLAAQPALLRTFVEPLPTHNVHYARRLAGAAM